MEPTILNRERVAKRWADWPTAAPSPAQKRSRVSDTVDQDDRDGARDQKRGLVDVKNAVVANPDEMSALADPRPPPLSSKTTVTADAANAGRDEAAVSVGRAGPAHDDVLEAIVSTRTHGTLPRHFADCRAVREWRSAVVCSVWHVSGYGARR
jgi:hypothetical protein